MFGNSIRHRRWNGLELEEEEHADDDQDGAGDDDAHGEVVLSAYGFGGRSGRARLEVLEAGAESTEDVGSVLMRVMSPAAATAPAPMGGCRWTIAGWVPWRRWDGAGINGVGRLLPKK